MRKTNEQFLIELESVWGDEFKPLEEYKGYNVKINLIHKRCGRILSKTPKNLVIQKYGCKQCKEKENGYKKRKTTNWFKGKVRELVADEYEVRGKYIKSKEPITMYHKICKKEFPTTPDAFLGKRNSNKNKGSRCPFCSNKWKRDTDEFKKEVYMLYGNEFEVIGNYFNRHTDIEIKHNVCNNTFPVRPRHFLDRTSYCQFCSNKVKKDTQLFNDQVSELVGDEYSVHGEYIDAKTPIQFFHNVCKEIYKATPDNFLRGRRCPLCVDLQNSKGYKMIREFLLDKSIEFGTQYRNPECRNIKPLPFDFVLYNKYDDIVAFIEFDGEQHERPSSLFGGEEGFKRLKKNDEIKNEFARSKSIPLIRIKYKDINKINMVLKRELIKINIDC